MRNKLTADTIRAHNTFDKPDLVEPAEFDAVEIVERRLTITLPSKSVVAIEVE